jgi:hypothetical protein
MAERCIQCRNPHHDGICSCGQWGEAEEKQAAKTIARIEKERAADRKVRLAQMQAEHEAEVKAVNATPIEDLEGLWGSKAADHVAEQTPKPPWYKHGKAKLTTQPEQVSNGK